MSKSSLKRLDALVPFCRKCNGVMIKSKAIEQTYTGKPDFIGSSEVVTMSAGGKGKLVDCLKCEDCGWSVT